MPQSDDSSLPALPFSHTLQLENVTFSYRGTVKPSLKGVTLTVRPRESIGLVGRTGAGKTTLAEIILGLYKPSAGHVSVDGIRLGDAAIRAWRKRVGYVPQHVFLANASIRENIAFALPPDRIDDVAVRKAARLAQAEDFIASLPEGYDAVVGERGVKLSGGQRQRLGIARALYGEPAVLVFDEATSALDGLTEEAVMDEIRTLSGERTIVLIAHRLQTVEACDRIVMLNDGRIIADGSYDSLFATCPEFRRLLGRGQAAVALID